MNWSGFPIKIAVFTVILFIFLLIILSAAGALLPFILGAVIAYISTPLAGGMERAGVPSAVAAAAVAVLWLVLLVAAPLALLPLMSAQIQEIAAVLPTVVAKAEAWLGYEIDIGEWLVEQKRTALEASSGGSIAAGAKQAVATLFAIGGSGLSIAGSLLMVLLITPLSAFYFLKDRRAMAEELTDILPQALREPVLNFMHDLDSVMDEFLHGQLLVMFVMAVVYSLLLFFAGLDFAITIGVITGLFVFVPYVGFLLGVGLATLVGLTAFDAWTDILIVWLLMGVGTTVESFFITPKLIGEKVGLHPLAVLFALFLLGAWFGFVGLLIAVPMAAVLLVCARQLRHQYTSSELYR